MKNVSDELLCEVLHAWEEWTGTGTEFYKSIGFTHRQMAKLIGKAKKLKRDGHFGSNDHFKEIQLEGFDEVNSRVMSGKLGSMIELDQGKGAITRFPEVGQLVEYLGQVS